MEIGEIYTPDEFMKLVDSEFQEKEQFKLFKFLSKKKNDVSAMYEKRDVKRNYLTLTYILRKGVALDEFDTYIEWQVNSQFKIPGKYGIEKAKSLEEPLELINLDDPLVIDPKNEDGTIKGKLTGSLGIYKIHIVTEDTKRGYLVNCGFTTDNFTTVTGLFPAGYIISKDFYEKTHIQRDMNIDEAIKNLVKYGKELKEPEQST